LALALFVLVLVASVFLTFRSQSSSQSVDRETGPGDPTTRYQLAQQVDVHYGATWYPGRILQVKDDSYEISYDGWSSHWNEWVTAARLRARAPAPPVEAPAVGTGTYTAGDNVQIEWKGSWYPGRILEVGGVGYKITYDGYSSSWDEWVEPARLRRPGKQ
jgi:hypothetical protein